MKIEDYKFLVRVIGVYFDFEEDFTDLSLKINEIETEDAWDNFDIYYNGDVVISGRVAFDEDLIHIHDAPYPYNVLHGIKGKTFVDIIEQYRGSLKHKKAELLSKLNALNQQLSKIDVIESMKV